MTNDLLNQIRAARREAEAIAAAGMEPAAMRQAVAVLEKHLAELAADAEAEQQRQRDAWEARLAADKEKAGAEQQSRRADLEKMGALEERTAKRAGELLRQLNGVMEAAGELGNPSVANRARESLEAVAAKRRRRWARDTGDDYDMASFAWVAIGLIEADRLKARAVDMVLDAIGAETGILPEKSRRADIVAAVQRRFANGSFGTGATRKYEQFMLLHQAREEERKAIGADAIAAKLDTIQTHTAGVPAMAEREKVDSAREQHRVMAQMQLMELTQREVRLLQLWYDHVSMAAIARTMNISRRTVYNIKYAIEAKYAANTEKHHPLPSPFVKLPSVREDEEQRMEDMTGQQVKRNQRRK